MNTSRRLIRAGNVARKEEVRKTFETLIGEPTGKRPMGKSTRRWEGNITMKLKEIGVNTN